MGSAKVLAPGQRNTSYITSPYYRAPELVVECQQYTTAIDRLTRMHYRCLETIAIQM